MTRLVVTDPGAAHSAKNTTAPGLPNQPGNDSKGRTFMVPQELIARAAERTGYRPGLVTPVVQAIAKRSASGETSDQIAAHLANLIGPDNRAASATFVAWVLAEIERGGVR